jgi:hypothetical protein
MPNGGGDLIGDRLDDPAGEGRRATALSTPRHWRPVTSGGSWVNGLPDRTSADRNPAEPMDFRKRRHSPG